MSALGQPLPSRILRLLLLPLLLVLSSITVPAGPATADPIGSTLSPLAAASVAVGANHTCVVTKQRTVRCWGKGASGRLGYGNTDNVGDGATLGSETPALAGDVPLGGDAVAVGVGSLHTCALLTTGAVRCWGAGAHGRLGYGSTANVGDGTTLGMETPKDAGDVPLGGSAVAISVEGAHSCALMNGGAVRCWGYGALGRLGYGDEENIGDDELPQDAGNVPLGVSAVGVSVGAGRTCALLATGAVRCWGDGAYGQLGYGNEDTILSAAAAGDVPIGGPVVALSSGNFHSCAVLSGGGVRCWGWAGEGRLGYGDTLRVGDGQNSGKETPAAAGDIPLGGAATSVSAGRLGSCATMTTGAVRCWGSGTYGANGYANTSHVGAGDAPYATPADAGDIDLGGRALAVASEKHVCAVLEDATLRCWGFGGDGELGYGDADNIGDNETPASAGAVPVGALIQVDQAPLAAKTATKLKVKGKPSRDKKAPFVFKLKGKVKGSFARTGDTCSGKVKLVLKRGKKKAAKVKAPLTKKCTFKKKVKVKPGKLGSGSGRVKIKVQASFKGNDLLLGTKGRTKVYAR